MQLRHFRRQMRDSGSVAKCVHHHIFLRTHLYAFLRNRYKNGLFEATFTPFRQGTDPPSADKKFFYKRVFINNYE
jgi:hypothetical protein